jgi:hypothetical protein
MGGEINRRFWDSYLDDLNTIFPDILTFPEKNTWLPWHWESLKCNSISRRLQRNRLQKIDYMYINKIISAEAHSKFLKTNNTLQLVAKNKFSFFDSNWYNFYQETKIDEEAPAIINQLLPENNRRVYEGMLK